MRPAIRPIAEEIRIGQEWTEIHPEPPLEVSKQVQRVSIEVPDVADWDVRLDSGSFVTPDGTPVKIEVELIGADGTQFSLDSIGLGPGLTFSYLPADADQTGSRLPPSLKFKTVRLRSDTPLAAGRVSWICITNY